MDRRHFLTRTAAATAGLCAARGLFAQAAGSSAVPAVVRTKQGSLRGQRATDVVAYLGVPFAQPPVGPLRFLPPRPALPWQGERPALALAAAPLQKGQGRMSEDCLYLNVWAPAAPGPHPVLVWLYGGGNAIGATGGVANGAHFARNGIVCVTPAYRVGVPGFLDVAGVLGEAYAGSGNNGLLDQLQALAWVQENIAAFGGDPGRVTLGGESAGGKNTCTLLGAARSRGLFGQAIVESGGAQTVHTEAEALAMTQQFLESAGLRAATPESGSAAALRSMSGEQLMAAQAAFMLAYTGDFPFRAVVDGRLLTAAPLAGIRGGSTRGLRLLAGSNREESSFFLRGAELDGPIVPKEVTNLPLARIPAMEAKYRSLYPEWTTAQRKVRLLTAEEYWIPTLRVAEAHTANGGEAFFYRFDLPQLRGPLAGEVPHASELGFVWDDPPAAQPESPARTAMRTAVHGAWVEFIHGHAPALAASGAWPPFQLSDRPVMLIDEHSQVALDPAGAERRLWDGWPA